MFLACVVGRSALRRRVMFIACVVVGSVLRRRAIRSRGLRQHHCCVANTDGHGPPDGGRMLRPIPAMNMALLPECASAPQVKRSNSSLIAVATSFSTSGCIAAQVFAGFSLVRPGRDCSHARRVCWRRGSFQRTRRGSDSPSPAIPRDRSHHRGWSPTRR